MYAGSQELKDTLYIATLFHCNIEGQQADFAWTIIGELHVIYVNLPRKCSSTLLLNSPIGPNLTVVGQLQQLFILVRAACVRCQGTKCPLLTAFFLFSLLSAPVTFLAEGVIVVV